MTDIFHKYGRRLFSAAFLFLFCKTLFSQNNDTPVRKTILLRANKQTVGHTVKSTAYNYLPSELDRIGIYFSSDAYFNYNKALAIQFPARKTYIAPFPLWNNYNKTILGVAIHNKDLQRKKVEYFMAPMLSLNPASFAFVGDLGGTFSLRNKDVESLMYKMGYVRLAYDFDSKARNWNRFLARFTINFRDKRPFGERTTQLYIRNIFNVFESTHIYQSAFGKNNLAYNVNELGFFLRDNRIKHPYQLLVTLEYIQEFGRFAKPNITNGKAGKLSVEFKQKISYLSVKKGLDIRLFGGTFLGIPITNFDYRYRLSGYRGIWDYKFDNYYFGRADYSGITSRQFYESDANFKVLTPVGQTNRWMAAINLKASLPGPIPIKPYFDMGLFRQVITNAGTGEQIKSVNFSFSGGLMLAVINDVFEIYFPIFHSKDIKNNLAFNHIKWYNQIRFQINLLELNPKKIRNKIEWLPR